MSRASRLRGFQRDCKYSIYREWQNPECKVVMPVMCTGAGKTVLMGDIAAEYDGYGCAIAHRAELVGQIAVALAKEGVRHDIIAPNNTIKAIVRRQIEEVGASFYNPRANWKVASVDTVIRRTLEDRWTRNVGLVFQDEGHHVLRDNKWGRAMLQFPNARGLLPTATPERADGRGLGSHHDGLVDALVEGPSMRWMIENGMLCNYELRAPKTSDLDMEGVAITDSGEYNQEQMRRRVKSSKIVGDVVKTYLTHARGLKGITFAVDIEHATTIAAEYNKYGVPARVVSSEDTDAYRDESMRMLRNGDLLQLVNVDLFGEGTDVPCVQCVSFARPTASYGLYVQQFGRALRLMLSDYHTRMWDTYDVATRLHLIAQSEKPVAKVFDHVGNIVTHMGPPDRRQHPWTLDRRERRTRAMDGIPMRVCLNTVCEQPYERIHPACPYCGTVPPPPSDRSKPEFVDGDIILYDDALLNELFGKRTQVDGPCYIPDNVRGNHMVEAAIKKNHRARQEAQQALRSAMMLTMPPGLDERVAQRRFFHTYGVDTLTAQTLGSADADKLRQRILEKLA